MIMDEKSYWQLICDTLYCIEQAAKEIVEFFRCYGFQIVEMDEKKIVFQDDYYKIYLTSKKYGNADKNSIIIRLNRKKLNDIKSFYVNVSQFFAKRNIRQLKPLCKELMSKLNDESVERILPKELAFNREIEKIEAFLLKSGIIKTGKSVKNESYYFRGGRYSETIRISTHESKYGIGTKNFIYREGDKNFSVNVIEQLKKYIEIPRLILDISSIEMDKSTKESKIYKIVYIENGREEFIDECTLKKGSIYSQKVIELMKQVRNNLENIIQEHDKNCKRTKYYKILHWFRNRVMKVGK